MFHLSTFAYYCNQYIKEANSVRSCLNSLIYSVCYLLNNAMLLLVLNTFKVSVIFLIPKLVKNFIFYIQM